MWGPTPQQQKGTIPTQDVGLKAKPQHSPFHKRAIRAGTAMQLGELAQQHPSAVSAATLPMQLPAHEPASVEHSATSGTQAKFRGLGFGWPDLSQGQSIALSAFQTNQSVKTNLFGVSFFL